MVQGSIAGLERLQQKGKQAPESCPPVRFLIVEFAMQFDFGQLNDGVNLARKERVR
jgi:hypothetical protein